MITKTFIQSDQTSTRIVPQQHAKNMIKCPRAYKIRGRKRANHRMPNHKTWEKV